MQQKLRKQLEEAGLKVTGYKGKTRTFYVSEQEPKVIKDKVIQAWGRHGTLAADVKPDNNN